MKRQKAQNAIKGEGEFLFVNNTRGDLTLIKPPIKGPNPVPPGRTFVGDSYFFNLMKVGDVRLIETIKPVQKEEIMEKKLILDQPEKFTGDGQIEHVATEPAVKLNETQPKSKDNNKLITEDPLDGVEILLG
jgi:hypothetical protein